MSEVHNRWQDERKGFFRPLGSGCENAVSRTEVKCSPMHYWMTRLRAVSVTGKVVTSDCRLTFQSPQKSLFLCPEEPSVYQLKQFQ
ncbi:hypothetical protein CEXT_37021 [Caerostris extrusa]|uniref:Uncharacterized protein n=1 Tax=Caerostris extrusa TaxID=172846 RepID=A0AAV4ULQ8_CAEEX|nr:hypothetical protein CEXT_37021 [Caerostris extrusa]